MEEALKLFEIQFDKKLSAQDLRQDDDVLDTWFSSWLWPIEVFKGITNPGNKELRYYYPTSVLVTGQDIIFFWVARMIMAGFEFEQLKPFQDVYFTGMVRDKQGRKMSKSLGNSPDLLQLIERFGADAVRFGIMISSPAGNDLLFDEAALEQGRNFNNKIWNALKLVKIWEENQRPTNSTKNYEFAVNWFGSRLNEASIAVTELIRQFKLSEALKTIYSLIWDDFCSWYLEWIKPEQGAAMDETVYQKTVSYFTDLLQLLHPFMPFITEEIFHQLKDNQSDLCVLQYGVVGAPNKSILKEGEIVKTAITEIRNLRSKFGLKSFQVYFENDSHSGGFAIIKKNTKAGDVLAIKQPAPEGSITIVVGEEKIFIHPDIPVDNGSQKLDLQKELDIYRVSWNL